MSRVLTLSCLLGILLPVPAQSEAPSPAQTRLLNDVKYLASDELEGRGVDTKGINLAAEFVRKEFEKAGLDVTKIDGGAFQKFPMNVGTKLGKTNELKLVGPDGKSIDLKYDHDFRSCSFGGKGKFDGEILFLGYAIDAQKKGYTDFADVDVKDKIVIIMRRVPQQANKKGPFAGPHPGVLSRESSLTSKVSNAFRKGAKAVLFVNDPYSTHESLQKDIKYHTKLMANLEKELANLKPDQTDKKANIEKRIKQQAEKLQQIQKTGPVDELMTFGYGGNSQKKTVPIAHISIDICNQLLQNTVGKSLEEIEKEIDANLKPQSFVLKDWKATGEVSVDLIQAEVKNVIGVLEGEGPLKDETVVIGAHYDHVGMGGTGSLLPGSKAVHNGADDNASGTVSLIELARRMARQGQEKKWSRRIVFIAFTAEERGLIGSAHYCKNPLYPLESTVAMLNMDMVGRLKEEKLTVMGTGTAPRWDDQLDQLGEKFGFHVVKKPEGFGPSDHSSFYAKKIPVLHFFTGTHGDYHRPTDDWDKINLEGMARIVDLVYAVAENTINTKERPKYIEVKRKATIVRSGSRPYFGSIPDFGSEAAGYAISGTAPKSPAALGGLKGGDRIVLFGKDKIGSLDDFDLALRKFSAGDTVDVTVMREEKPVKLKVTLGKPR